MAEQSHYWERPGFWMGLIAIIILLIFLYFFEPFEKYVIAHVPQTRFHTVLFWFASLVAVLGFALAHWQSFRRHLFRNPGSIPVVELVFDTLQISLLTAVILCAGATLQAVEMLSEQMLFGAAAIGHSFGDRVMTILLLIILAIGFFLLHLLVRAVRLGKHPGRLRPRAPGSPNTS